jgi:hypothetical protein
MGGFLSQFSLFNLLGRTIRVARRSTDRKSHFPNHILGCIGDGRDSSHRRIVPGRRLVQLGPNRWRWLAHRQVNQPVSRKAQAAGYGYKPRTDSIVLHRRNRSPADAQTQRPGGLN